MATFRLLLGYVWDCFRSHERLRAEILILRHQLNILHRKAPKRLRLYGGDRALFVWLYRRFPDIGNAAAIVRPETIIRWHRMGFRAGPELIKNLEISCAVCARKIRFGAARIHGELLKLGFDVAQSTVSKYMLRRRGPPSQGWKTFLRNHADRIASVDFLIVPTLAFERLFVFVILGLGRRRLLWIGVTTNPTAEWLARQITEAFPWDTVPGFLIRDNDGAYGEAFTRRLRAMGIRDRHIAPRSPWQNGYVERSIGSIRHECLDHVIIWGEAHLRQVLKAYTAYYNATRTHLGIDKDALNRRPIERCGVIVANAVLGGLTIATRGY